jgi:hypothetical protein
LREYVDEDYLKELEMAFKSVGQKYGFVSAGDVFRKRLADAHAETQEAKDKLAQNKADTEAVLREIGLSEDKIVEVQTRLEALQQSRLAK